MMNIFSNEINEKLLNAKNFGRHLFLGNQKFYLPTWKEIIDCLDKNIMEENYIRTLDDFGLVIHKTSDIPVINDILKEYSKIDPEVPSTAHIYISFSSKSKTFGWHKDPADVLFWQVIGSTNFFVEDEKVFSYNLGPNDMLFIPRGMMHNTIPITPRVGVSMGLNY